jgi:threonine/homoserine/homoserine lactone efflux protein
MIVDPQTFAFFFLAVLLLLVSPGPNMLFVLGSGAGHGWRGGMAAACGIGVADLVCTLACALGLAGLITAYPLAFDIVRWVGAAYMLYLAYKCVAPPRAPTAATATATRNETSRAAIFFRGLAASLSNPKAILFFIVFIPQFIDAQRGSVFLQFVLLGTTLAVIGTAFHGAIGAVGSLGARFASGRPGTRQALAYLQAAIFCLIAGRLLLG